MIKVIIVDDELNAREFLEKVLNRYFPNKFIILAKCETVDEALCEISNNKPDLVFLDIQMPEKNGFELLKSITQIDFEVVFTTAHKDFAIKAIRYSAFDYLLKPVSYIDLISTVKRFEERNSNKTDNDRIKLLLENLNNSESNFNKIALPTETGYELIKQSQIAYCKADDNYCVIHLIGNRKIIIAKTLKYVEELISSNNFIRTHKSYLVNLNYIERFSKTNDMQAELTDGTLIPVSFRKKDEFIKAITTKH
tara:strand:+ start:2028 stop:2783 length:756 start_codon:yes stop_codon:yes gene_type:complete